MSARAKISDDLCACAVGEQGTGRLARSGPAPRRVCGRARWICRADETRPACCRPARALASHLTSLAAFPKWAAFCPHRSSAALPKMGSLVATVELKNPRQLLPPPKRSDETLHSQPYTSTKGGLICRQRLVMTALYHHANHSESLKPVREKSPYNYGDPV